MKTIQLLFISLFILFACADYKVEPAKPNKTISGRLEGDSTPLKVFVVMWAQSNGAYFTNSAMSGTTIHGVHGFDQKNLNWVDSLSYRQIETGAGLTTYKWSPLLGVAELLVISRPEDDLYFAYMGQAGINLYNDLNPIVNANNRFREYVLATNSAVAQAGPFDEVIFIYIQGESDVNPTYSAEYFTNEKNLFDSVDALYNPDQILNYKIYGNSVAVVNQAKYDNAAQRTDTKVITIPIIVSGPTAQRTYPAPGDVHMTKNGVNILVDSLFENIN